jgi:bacterioferritin-associated ferredoxin
MVVCVCNAIRERDVREAARNGARSPGKAYEKLGCRLQCGQCVPFARSIISQERAIAC